MAPSELRITREWPYEYGSCQLLWQHALFLPCEAVCTLPGVSFRHIPACSVLLLAGFTVLPFYSGFGIFFFCAYACGPNEGCPMP